MSISAGEIGGPLLATPTVNWPACVATSEQVPRNRWDAYRKFDPSKFEDTYDDAIMAMIDAKRKGKAPPKPAPKPKENVVNLAEILRKSLASKGGSTAKATPSKRSSAYARPILSRCWER